MRAWVILLSMVQVLAGWQIKRFPASPPKKPRPYRLLVTAGGRGDQNRPGLFEIDLSGQCRWTASKPGFRPGSADRLPGGKTLILNCRFRPPKGVSYAEGNRAYRTVVIDKKGRELWQYQSRQPAGGGGVGPHGRILLTEPFENRILCFDTTGKKLWSLQGPPGEACQAWAEEAEPPYPYRAYDAELTPDGKSILIADTWHHRVVELTLVEPRRVLRYYGRAFTAGRKLPRRDLLFPRCVHRRSNGNILITEWGKGRAKEITPHGRVVWSYSNLRRPEQMIDAPTPDPLPAGWKKPATDYILFIADAGAGRVLVLDGHARPLHEFPFLQPTGVSLVPIKD